MTQLLKGRLKIWRLPVLVQFTAIFLFSPSLPCVVPNVVFHLFNFVCVQPVAEIEEYPKASSSKHSKKKKELESLKEQFHAIVWRKDAEIHSLQDENRDLKLQMEVRSSCYCQP